MCIKLINRQYDDYNYNMSQIRKSKVNHWKSHYDSILRKIEKTEKCSIDSANLEEFEHRTTSHCFLGDIVESDENTRHR